METQAITEKISGCAFRVANRLGFGFLEKVYENAVAHELRKAGLLVLQQSPVPVFYDDVEVGLYCPDLVVEHRVVVELKVAKSIDRIHEAQLLNYLRATRLETGLILNFGTPKIGIRRMDLGSIPF